MTIDETKLLKSMQSALPERFVNQYGGAFARNQTVNKLSYVIFDASYTSWVEPCTEVLRLMNCRRALWSLPCTADGTIRPDCYPDGLKQAQEAATRFKEIVPNLGLHCMSFAVAPNSETAKDSRLLKFSDGTLAKGGGYYLPNAELAAEIGQRLGRLFLDIGMNQGGGVYFDGMDYIASGNITDPATGKLICNPTEVILNFQNAFLKTVGGCPAEGSMPGASQWFSLSHYQAWDWNENTSFKDFIDRHRVDKAKNSGTLVKNYGWWRRLDKMTVADTLYGLHACESDGAIWSAFIRDAKEMLKTEHRDKLDMLRWWNERKETV